MDEKFKKLPVWAQKHIEKIERERDLAVRALNESLDRQTPSAFYSDDLVCTGEARGPTRKRVYFTAPRMSVAAFGVELNIYVREDNKRIELQWSDPKRLCTPVAFVPTSLNQACLMSKDNM